MPSAAVPTIEPGSSSPSAGDSSRSTRGHLSPEQRLRDTARSIGDRVRRVLIPADSPIATLRFLVVDDHPDTADSLAAVLELLGLQVRACYDGATALLIAARFDPQVCLLDLKMPVMDGYQLAAHLRAYVKGRPLLLIATTAMGDDESRRRSMEAGFLSHLVKPVDAPTLIDAIIRYWVIVRQQGGGDN
jgi:CheY-like chemotaxis protein